MPLTMLTIGEESSVKRVTGDDKTKRFLEHLGIMAGEKISIVSEITGNIIVSVRDSRIALDRNVAKRILV